MPFTFRTDFIEASSWNLFLFSNFDSNSLRRNNHLCLIYNLYIVEFKLFVVFFLNPRPKRNRRENFRNFFFFLLKFILEILTLKKQASKMLKCLLLRAQQTIHLSVHNIYLKFRRFLDTTCIAIFTLFFISLLQPIFYFHNWML